jgi:DNA-binding transcriptional LysR family regulator
VPDWARPWPEGLHVVRLPLPVPFETRCMGVVWSRGSIRIRLVEAFLREAYPEADIQP